VARNRFFDDEELEHQFDYLQFKRILKYLRPYKKKMIAAVVIMFVSIMLVQAGPLFIKTIVDKAIPNKDLKLLAVLIGTYLLFVCFSILLSTIKGYLMNTTGQSVVYDLRKDLFAHLQKLSFKYFDDRPTGKILIRITTYIDSLSTLLSDGILNLITETFSLIIILVLMFTISIKLTLISLITCIPLIFIVSFFKRRLHKLFQNNSNKNSNRTAYIHENIMGAKLIQMFVRENVNEGIAMDLNYTCANAWMSTVKINNLFWPAIDIINVFGVAIIYYFSFILLKNNGVTLGIIIAFSAYMMFFWQPINNLTAIYNQLLNAMAYIERIFEMQDEEPDIKDAENAFPLPPILGNVELNNVTFGYDRATPVLQNLNLKVKSGESVALVGPSGAGKTTIVSLISRFYDIDKGEILIDGIDIRKVTLKSLRSQMGIIMQDSFIFEGTIMENIRYGRLDATEDEIIAAAKLAFAHELIMRLPLGYNTKVNERGSSLSTGERQLISFARVILSDPKILVMDEATSNIDTETEKKIQLALSNLLKGRTSFVIAHRLSTIREVSRIVYVENKTVLEDGCHDELIEKKGYYYTMHRSQYAEL